MSQQLNLAVVFPHLPKPIVFYSFLFMFIIEQKETNMIVFRQHILN